MLCCGAQVAFLPVNYRVTAFRWGAILHLPTTITFCSFVTFHKLSNFRFTNKTSVHFLRKRCKRVSSHAVLCQARTMQTFHFHIWFPFPPSPLCLPQLLLLSRRCGPLFSVCSFEQSWQTASSTWHTANSNHPAETREEKKNLWGLLD